jgi:hypothetical protein
VNIWYKNILLYVSVTRPFATLVSNIASGVLNLAFIVLIDHAYAYAAEKIAKWGMKRKMLIFILLAINIYTFLPEMHRTETDYEESLIIKLFVFLSFNYFSHAFYIAFLKERYLLK